jgi:hypothetical protein
MMPPMRWLACAVLALAACGPVAYVGQVTFKADGAVDEARRAHAEQFSPYWWTRANQYLRMAREVAGHADYQGANKFGRLAAEAAEKAKEEAEIGARDPSKLPYIDLEKEKGRKNTLPAKGGAEPAPAKDVAPAKEGS